MESFNLDEHQMSSEFVPFLLILSTNLSLLCLNSVWVTPGETSSFCMIAGCVEGLGCPMNSLHDLLNCLLLLVLQVLLLIHVLVVVLVVGVPLPALEEHWEISFDTILSLTDLIIHTSALNSLMQSATI